MDTQIWPSNRAGPPIMRDGFWVIWVVLLILTGTLAAHAAPWLSGSATVWAYAKDDSVDHLKVVPLLSLTVRELGSPALRFETTVRRFTDIVDREFRSDQLRVLKGVLVYAPEKSSWEWRVGQQWLTEGVARGNVAGLWTRYRLNRKTSFTAYAGARLPYSFSLEHKNPNEGVAGGVHVRSRVKCLQFGGSYYYASKGGDLLYQAAGIEVSKPIGPKLSARGRLEMNLGQSAIERAQLLADWRPQNKLHVTTEIQQRTPRVFEDSYFTLFIEDSKTTFVRGAARWNYFKTGYLRGGGTLLFSESPDPLYKMQLAAGARKWEIGYTRWLSVAKGKMNGFFGEVRLPIRKVADVFGGFDFARGSNSELKPETESQMLFAGASVTPVSPLSLSAQVEQVSDLERKDDWRGLCSATIRFSSRRGGIR